MATTLRVAHKNEYFEEKKCDVCDATLIEGKTVVTGDEITCDECGTVYAFFWTGLEAERIV